MKRFCILCAVLAVLLGGCSAAATKVEAKKSGPEIRKHKATKPAGKKRIIIRPCTIEKCEVPRG